MKIMYKIRLITLFFLISSVFGSNVIKSMAIPGLGEKSLGEDSRAKMFMYSEIAVWGMLFLGKSFNKYYIDSYSGFAELHAGANMEDKSYSFVVDMSNYDSVIDFNEDMMRHHNNNYFEDTYDAEGGYFWDWNTTENRNKFNDMRENSIISEKFAEFAIAGLLINRIASVIDVIYLEKKGINIDVAAYVYPEGKETISLNVSFSLK